MFTLNRKTLAAAIISSLLVGAASTFLIYGNTPNIGPYYLDVPFGGYNWYIRRFQNGSWYAVSLDNWKCEIVDANPVAVINYTRDNLPWGWGSIRLEGQCNIEEPIVFTKSHFQINHTFFRFHFDRIRVDANCSGIILQNLTRPFEVKGFKLHGALENHAKPLLLMQNVDFANVEIDFLSGDHIYGRSIGIELRSETDDHFYCNSIKIVRSYALEKVLFVNMSGDSLGFAINDIDIGFCEGYSPRQIHVSNNSTGTMANNVFRGSTGDIDNWNPQNLSEIWTIKLETHNTGSIYCCRFVDFYLYSPANMTYYADDGVYHTTFVRGKPAYERTEFLHDNGHYTEVISAHPTLSPYAPYTILNSTSYGTVEASNEDYAPHYLADKPRTVILTCMNGTYKGEPVIVNCNYENTNATHFQISLHWANGTAITTDLLIGYYATYEP
jgi:hypothetical protein